jgi:hypothetical protein
MLLQKPDPIIKPFFDKVKKHVLSVEISKRPYYLGLEANP